MFNGHLDTSYSGEEPWLRDIPGFRPEGFERDGRIYGLGISNMKGALACYVEAVRSLVEDGVRLKGDVMIAAVAGEIEKTQQGDAQGAEFRGYAAGSRYLVGHGGAADVCILGEPTENKLVLAHFGTLWLRLRVSGPFIHTASRWAGSRRTRSSECDPCSTASWSGSRTGRRRCRTARSAGSPTSARSRAASAGAPRAHPTRPTCSSTSAFRRTSRWRRLAERRSSSPEGWRTSTPRST